MRVGELMPPRARLLNNHFRAFFVSFMRGARSAQCVSISHLDFSDFRLFVHVNFTVSQFQSREINQTFYACCTHTFSSPMNNNLGLTYILLF